jgi:hypothetical protein
MNQKTARVSQRQLVVERVWENNEDLEDTVLASSEIEVPDTI